MAFNREYKPLGWSTTEWVEYEKYPVFAKYKDLTNAKLLKIASETPGAVVKDQDGKIIRAFLYDDNTNPVDNPKYWPAYFERIKSLSKFIAQ